MFKCLWSKRGPVDREGCGIPQNGGNALVLEHYGRMGVLFIGRGVAFLKTGLHGLLFIHCLVPRSSLHGLLFIHR